MEDPVEKETKNIHPVELEAWQAALEARVKRKYGEINERIAAVYSFSSKSGNENEKGFRSQEFSFLLAVLIAMSLVVGAVVSYIPAGSGLDVVILMFGFGLWLLCVIYYLLPGIQQIETKKVEVEKSNKKSSQ